MRSVARSFRGTLVVYFLSLGGVKAIPRPRSVFDSFLDIAAIGGIGGSSGSVGGCLGDCRHRALMTSSTAVISCLSAEETFPSLSGHTTLKRSTKFSRVLTISSSMGSPSVFLRQGPFPHATPMFAQSGPKAFLCDKNVIPICQITSTA